MQRFLSRAGLIAMLALCTQCTSAIAPHPLTGSSELEQLRRDILHSVTAHMEHQWHHESHGEASGDLPSTFSEEGAAHWLEALKNALERSDSDQTRALLYLRGYLVEKTIGGMSAPIHRELQAALEKSTVNIQGASIRWRDLPEALSHLGAAERRAVAAQETSVVRKLQPILARRTAQVQAAASALGYASYLQVLEEVHGYSPTSLKALARRVLRQSDILYQHALAELAPAAAGVGAAQLQWEDLPRLLYFSPFDAAYQDSLTAPEATLDAMGFGLASLPIAIDLQRNAATSSGATFPISIPNDIRIRVQSGGGLRGHEIVFHELGHALHFLHTQEAAFEFQKIGSRGTAEGFAFLWQALATNPEWVESHLNLPRTQARTIQQHGALRRLLWLRREAACILLALDATEHPQRLEQLPPYFEQAYGIGAPQHAGLRCLVDPDGLLSSIGYLEGWLLSSYLANILEQEHGPHWWKSNASATLLQRLWASGQKLHPSEFVAEWGADRFGPEPFLRKVAQDLLGDAPVPSGWQTVTGTP